jgi:UDP-2,3-diacylglucosamine pyrophosphatase LpxH
MCPGRNQKRLASLVASLPRPTSVERVHLVLAGDIVDFLAEKDFRPFTSAEAEACEKLRKIIGRTPLFWDALRAFVSSGGSLTLMLGNHDIEMSLPAARRTVYDALGEGRIGFVYDNEAFTVGPVLVEHGNRYDGWNAVPYGALRRVRSRLSRRMPAQRFPAMPGSRLVVEVMNGLKNDYSWVDLLKPETAAVLPILAALGAGGLTDIWKAYRQYRQSAEVEYDNEREPEDETYIAAATGETPAEASDQEMYNLAQDILAGGDATAIGAAEFIGGARNAVNDAVRAARREALFRALRAFARYQRRTFDMSTESEMYLTPARLAAKRGFEVVVYGHTHLAKRVELDSPSGKAVYLNSGTWADLMRMPDAVFGDDSAAAKSKLKEFVAGLEKDDVSRWRRMAPTFVRVDLDDDQVESSNVYFSDEESPELATTEGLLKRLDPEETDV